MNLAQQSSSVARVFKLFKNPATFYLDKLGWYGKDAFLSMRLKNGLQYKVHSGNTEVALFSEVFFSDLYREFFAMIRPEMNILDIGANVGIVSVAAAQKLEGGVVHAFEINPEVVPLLRENVALNNMNKKIIVHPIGVAGKTETMQMYFKPYHWGGAHIAHEGARNEGKEVDVPCIKFHDIFALTRLARIDLMKMDIEGGEKEVLEGMTSDDFKKIGAMLLEYHEPYVSAEKIKAQLEENGFTVALSRDFNALLATRE